MDCLALVAPFRRVLEVGCHVGPNLRLLRTRFPEVELYGVDVNLDAVKYGREHFRDDPRTNIWCADALREWQYWLPEFLDVVFSCYALAYVAPDDLDPVLAGFASLPARALILAEPTTWAAGSERIADLPHPEWRHNYYRRLLDLASDRWAGFHVRPVDPPADRLDSIVMCTFTEEAARGLPAL